MRLKKSILSLAVVALTSSVAMAQTGVASGTPFGSGQDSIRCRQNLSIFGNHAKVNNFADAYDAWVKAYKECPGSSKNIYIYGPRILKWKISQEKDATKKQALINDLLAMYDTRAKYFGDDAKYGVDVIVSTKIKDYVEIYGEKADYNQIYDWAKPVIDQYKEQTSPQLLNYYVYASQLKARADEKLIEAYIGDYQLVAGYLDQQLVAAGEDAKAKEAIEANKTSIDQSFASSGVASCDLLQKVYTSEKIDAHKADKGYLEQTCNLFLSAGCDAPVYFQAARYLFDIEPNAKAAMGLAGKAIQDRKFGEAQEYLQKAVQLSSNNADKIKCYELMVSISMSQGNHSAANAAINNLLALDSRNGRAMIARAQMLASAADNLFPGDPVKQRCVFYLVIDRLRAAASADPSVSSEANRLISSYRAHLPKPADIFMHPELGSGKTFTVPGYGSVVLP